MTSAQVGITSEVARSNSQAREIFQYTDEITATVKQVQAKVRTLHLYSTHSHTHTHKHTHTHTLNSHKSVQVKML